ncbi:MAG: hypothetical protein HQL65_04590 [Magnetococcales bacterium]|nr:hypothetical protein [Magnetococcales bacterium]
MRVVFRLDADHRLGYGHLLRCLALAGVVARRGGQVAFVMVRADPPACTMIEAQGWPWTILSPRGPYASEVGLWKDANLGLFDAVVLDIAHQRTFRQLDQIPFYVNSLREHFGLVVLLDGLREHAIAARRPLMADLVVMPYPDADNLLPGTPARRLAGPEYGVFPAELLSQVVLPRPVRNAANRLLVTCGGSDPTRLTLLCLEALEKIADRHLLVRIAVAAGFAPELADTITTRAAASRHQVDILAAPKGLGTHMLWCDLALTATGLTKYELALTGTPSIQISIDPTHHAVNGSFAAQGTALNLGIQESLSPATLADAICRTLDDVTQRQTMSRKGQTLVDGRGADRILDEMEALILARP